MWCLTDCHFLGGISPSLVLPEEKDKVEILLGAVNPGVFGLRPGESTCDTLAL